MSLAEPRTAQSEALLVEKVVDASGESCSAGVGSCAGADWPNRTSHRGSCRGQIVEIMSRSALQPRVDDGGGAH